MFAATFQISGISLQHRIIGRIAYNNTHNFIIATRVLEFAFLKLLCFFFFITRFIVILYFLNWLWWIAKLLFLECLVSCITWLVPSIKRGDGLSFNLFNKPRLIFAAKLIQILPVQTLFENLFFERSQLSVLRVTNQSFNRSINSNSLYLIGLGVYAIHLVFKVYFISIVKRWYNPSHRAILYNTQKHPEPD